MSGSTLTTEMTRYVIDGTEVTTDKVALSGNTSKFSAGATHEISGYINLNGDQIEFYIVN